MADINVNIVLPDPISIDVTSSTQALATNISVPAESVVIIRIKR